MTTYDPASLPEQVFGRLDLAIQRVNWCSMLRAIPQNNLTVFPRFTETFEEVFVIAGVVIQIRGNNPAVRSLAGQDSPWFWQVVRVIVLEVNDQKCRPLYALAEMTFQFEISDILPGNLIQHTVVNSQELGRHLNHVIDLAKIQPQQTQHDNAYKYDEAKCKRGGCFQIKQIPEA
ncbi:hypothetical protein [Marinobacter halophilus]|uniref:hypothetical protein n=1 Tax=Marinobacter halophilus TaxID=1323740 RepID=UPI00105715F2|nr:hypothetical protein [Marinobacter halophilus]